MRLRKREKEREREGGGGWRTERGSQGRNRTLLFGVRN